MGMPVDMQPRAAIGVACPPTSRARPPGRGGARLRISWLRKPPRALVWVRSAGHRLLGAAEPIYPQLLQTFRKLPGT
jgi:hypothetical protein